MCCEMYNALLESWKGSYAWWAEHRHYLPDGARHQLDHTPITTQVPPDTVTEEELKFPPERSQSKYDLFKVFTPGTKGPPGLGQVAYQGREGCDFPFPTAPSLRSTSVARNPARNRGIRGSSLATGGEASRYPELTSICSYAPAIGATGRRSGGACL